MRNLATIQRIERLTSIPDADRIELANIKGWQVVVKKGDFKEGDLVVYCEIDSILPDKPEFEFMRERKFRVRTIKLRKQLSQGICFPLSILPNYDRPMKWGYEVEKDVTEILGITKYDPQAIAEQKETERKLGVEKSRFKRFFLRYTWFRRLFAPMNRLPFPAFIKKTDEERIQNMPWVCEKEKDTMFRITEKIDGTSATYFVLRNKPWKFWKPFIFGVCSRNYQLVKPDNSSYWKVANKLNIKERMIEAVKFFGLKSLVWQGEIIGPNIQGNKYNVKDYDLYLFNLYVDGVLSFPNRIECGNFNFVPLIAWKSGYFNSVADWLVFADRFSVLNPDIPAEGIVCRNYEKGISFKVINNKFLLKYEE
jgi:hypothetical protein